MYAIVDYNGILLRYLYYLLMPLIVSKVLPVRLSAEMDP